jgi:cytochrome c peroxidase
MNVHTRADVHRTLNRRAAAIVVLAGTLPLGCSGPVEPASPDEEMRQQFALGPLGAVHYPDDNQRSEQRIALGRLLFFDPILGGERDVACGTCHHPDFHFADGRQFAAGVSGVGLGPDRHVGVSSVSGDSITTAARNTPTILNTAFALIEATDGSGNTRSLAPLFWDGRAIGLEGQALVPLGARVEMRGDAFPDIERNEGYLPGTDEAAESTVDSILARIRNVPEYVTLFGNAFPDQPPNETDLVNRSTLSRALAAYERELVTLNSPFDRWLSGEDAALDDLQRHGLELFFTKAKCSVCHRGAVLSTFRFMVTGVPQEGPGKRLIPGDDLGREEHTLDPRDRYKFRVPTLRNVEITAPYMHSGVFASLEDVVRFYNSGSQPRHPKVRDDVLDPTLRQPLGLTDDEVHALVSFLRSLTDPGTQIDQTLRTVPSTVPSGLVPVYGVAGY